ncbi:MAG: hypothetical protein Tsb0016_01690 [Sphingomonadales bacterium]
MTAPRKLRCRQGHVYDAAIQALCPACGEGPAEAPAATPILTPGPNAGADPGPAPRPWLARLGGWRGLAGIVAAVLVLLLAPRLLEDDGPRALEVPNPLGLSAAALEAAMLDQGERAAASGAVAQARSVLAPLAKAGNAAAHFKLGALEQASGNAKAAFKHFRKAAETPITIAEAQFQLGLAYESGQGVGRDRDRALAAYQAAAQQEHGGAQAALARLAVPAGAGPDLAAARELFNAKHYNRAFPAVQALAAAGAIRANQLLGEMQFYGLGLPPDPVAAIRTFERGARNGYGPSQYFVGYGYAKGTGVKASPAEAYLWYSLAQRRVSADNQREWLAKAMAELLPQLPPGDKAAVDRLLGL